MAEGSPGLEIIPVQAVQVIRGEGGDPEGDVHHLWLCVPKRHAGFQFPWGGFRVCTPWFHLS